jgi:hypothetical protein
MITPSELQIKWDLTNAQLAIVLGKTEQTIKQYKVNTSAKSYRKPPETVLLLCSLLDEKWSKRGLVSIQLIAV